MKVISLFLHNKNQEIIRIKDNIVLYINKPDGVYSDRIRFAIDAPKEIKIFRNELKNRTCKGANANNS